MKPPRALCISVVLFTALLPLFSFAEENCDDLLLKQRDLHIEAANQRVSLTLTVNNEYGRSLKGQCNGRALDLRLIRWSEMEAGIQGTDGDKKVDVKLIRMNSRETRIAGKLNGGNVDLSLHDEPNTDSWVTGILNGRELTATFGRLWGSSGERDRLVEAALLLNFLRR